MTLYLCRLQLLQPVNLPDLLHETERLQRLPGLLLLPLPGGGQDEPAEPLHAVAGRAGRQAGPTDICVRKGDIAVTVGITLTWGTRSIAVDMMPLCQEGRGGEGPRNQKFLNAHCRIYESHL